MPRAPVPVYSKKEKKVCGGVCVCGGGGGGRQLISARNMSQEQSPNCLQQLSPSMRVNTTYTKFVFRLDLTYSLN